MNEIFLKSINIFSSQLFLLQLAVAFAILISSFVLRKLFIQYIISYLSRFGNLQSQEKNEVKANLLQSLTTPLGIGFIILGLYCVSVILNLPQDVSIFLDHIFNTLVLMTLFLTLYRVLDPLSFLFDRLSGALGTNLYQEMKGFILAVLKALIVIVGSLSVLQEWGINVAAFLAGLGLVGMAVALAAQDTMKNLFGSLAVLMDQTFIKGDYIQTPDVEGIVERIGLRTTMIRRFDKALVTIPNASLANAAVINFSRMTHRRVLWKIGLAYDTPSQQLERIVQRIRQYLETHGEIETDAQQAATSVYLDELENSTITLSCCFFTKTIDWMEYMRIKEEALLAFRSIIQEEGGRIAFPSYSLYLDQQRDSSNWRQFEDALKIKKKG